MSLCTVSVYGSTSRRHCIKFSVMPMLTWMSQTSTQSTTTAAHRIVSESHMHVGKLPGSYSSTVFSRLNPFYTMSVPAPPCLQSSSSHIIPFAFRVNHAHDHINIPEYTEHFIHTYIVRRLLSRSMWGSLRLTPKAVYRHNKYYSWAAHHKRFGAKLKCITMLSSPTFEVSVVLRMLTVCSDQVHSPVVAVKHCIV